MRLTAEFLRSITFKTYKHAKTKPDVFYSLSEAVKFDELCHLYDFTLLRYAREDADVIKFAGGF